MQYSGDSYKIHYHNSQFDSIGELTWFLFLEDIGITSIVTSQPLAYKKDLNWYPDLYFVLFTPSYFKIYVEVKPLSKNEFDRELNLPKYKISDATTCIFGLTFKDFQILSNNEQLENYFDKYFLDNQSKWEKARQIAEEFAHKYGTFKKSNMYKKEIWLDFGKYKGFSLKEIKQKDIIYYNWYVETFDPDI